MADGTVRDRELEVSAAKDASAAKALSFGERLSVRNNQWLLLAATVGALLLLLVVLLMLINQGGKPATAVSSGLYAAMMCGVMLTLLICVAILLVGLKIYDRIEDLFNALDRIEEKVMPRDELSRMLGGVSELVVSETTAVGGMVRERLKPVRKTSPQPNLSPPGLGLAAAGASSPVDDPRASARAVGWPMTQPTLAETAREAVRGAVGDAPERPRFEVPGGDSDALEGYEFDTPPATLPDNPNAGVRTSDTRPAEDFFVQLQRCVENAFIDGHAPDEQKLTQIVHAWGRNSPFARFVPDLLISAHDSTKDLAKDFRSPDFISIVKRQDQIGWLLPNPRAQYAGTHTRFYGGEKNNWPLFSKPATCSVDSTGKANLLKKGVL